MGYVSIVIRPWPMLPPQHRRARLNGVDLHWVEAGPSDSAERPVILLHGFPEFWYGWRHQIPPLAMGGFRVAALDMRGYAESAKPARVSDYRMDRLVGDVTALIDRLGGRAHLVGHDWGGVVAWHAAMAAPERIARLVVLNAPHPAAYLREVRKPRQAMRSYYAFFFQLPWLPEALTRANDFHLLRRLFRRDPAEPFSSSVIDAYLCAFDRPRGLAGPINYYRAAFRSGTKSLRAQVRHIDVPTLLLWGMRDRFLVPELTEGLEPHVPQLRVERHPRATHWLHHDDPAWVNERLIEFLRE